MYKVFIQNKPLFFVSKEEINNLSGIFISETLALNDKTLVSNILKQNNLEISLFILCENPEKSFQLYFNDYEKVEAAGGIVQRKNRFLFIKRNGVWDIPKGKLEKKEIPEVGAVREIEEECGIQSPVVTDLITITYHTYSYNDTPTLKKTYWYSLNYEGKKVGTPQLEEGITKISWKKSSSFSKILTNTYASIEDVVRQFIVKNNINIEI
jgi:8-oxo-dGTP pyrophosphatase MutT (NUDIX family)